MNKVDYYEKLRININDNINNISKLIRDLNYKIKDLQKSKNKTDALIMKFEVNCYTYNYVDEMKCSRDEFIKYVSILIKRAKRFVSAKPVNIDNYINSLNEINDSLYKSIVEIRAISKDDLSNIENLQINAIKKAIYEKYMIMKSDIDREKIKEKFDKIQNKGKIAKALDKFLCREDIIEQKKENLFVAIRGIDESLENMIKNEMPTRDYKIVDILADMEIFIKENAKDVKYRPKLNDIIELYNKINSTFSVNSEDMKKAIAEKYQSRLPVVIDKKMNKLKRERQKILQFLNRSGYNETLIEVKSEPKMKILIKKLNILSQNIEKELDR